MHIVVSVGFAGDSRQGCGQEHQAVEPRAHSFQLSTLRRVPRQLHAVDALVVVGLSSDVHLFDRSSNICAIAPSGRLHVVTRCGEPVQYGTWT